MTPPGITCLIPAFNEAPRIAGVLSVVVNHPQISEVLVIDDGSTDDTAAIARSHGVRVLANTENQGKSQALATGLRECRLDHVLLLDADLLGLGAAEVTALIRPVMEGRALASISLRGNAPLPWRMIGIDYISGERLIPRALLAGHLDQIGKLPRFGFEVFLNQLLIAADRPVAVVKWPGVASPYKTTKRGWLAGLRADAAMIADILRIISPAQALAQIIGLRRLARRG